jgi:SAM-dependent methyltransferase
MIQHERFTQVFAQFSTIAVEKLVEVLLGRLAIENISQYFEIVADYTYEGKTIYLHRNNSLLLKFPTLKNRYPDFYDAAFYKLLVMLDLRTEKEFGDSIQLDLDNISRQDNIDCIVIWTTSDPSPALIQRLKSHNVDVIVLRKGDAEKMRTLSNFMPVDCANYDDVIAVNAAAELLLRRLKKLFHLILSEIAAPIYDRLYAKDRVATSAQMEYEIALIKRLVGELKKSTPPEVIPSSKGKRLRYAVDVGCGTGRHTFPLATEFDKIFAFDFSQRMIAQAGGVKKKQDITNIYFSVADLEYEEIRDEHNFRVEGEGQVDLVIASFGMASFIENTEEMLRRFSSWVRPGGLVVLSFYNADSLILKVTPNWRDTSLSAQLDVKTNTLRVELTRDSVFHVYCKPFNKEMENRVREIFEIDEIHSYPTLMALMPNELLKEETAYGLFKHLDEYLSTSDRYRLGYYITIVSRKPSIDLPIAFNRILKLLLEYKIQYELLEHPPAFTTKDVRRHVGGAPGVVIKTVVFTDRKGTKFGIVVLLAEKRMEISQLASEMSLANNDLHKASEIEIQRLGFQPGSVAPFGYLAPSQETSMEYFVDSEITEGSARWLYMACGEVTRTLKLDSKDFCRIISDYRSIRLDFTKQS